MIDCIPFPAPSICSSLFPSLSYSSFTISGAPFLCPAPCLPSPPLTLSLSPFAPITLHPHLFPSNLTSKPIFSSSLPYLNQGYVQKPICFLRLLSFPLNRPSFPSFPSGSCSIPRLSSLRLSVWLGKGVTSATSQHVGRRR